MKLLINKNNSNQLNKSDNNCTAKPRFYLMNMFSLCLYIFVISVIPAVAKADNIKSICIRVYDQSAQSVNIKYAVDGNNALKTAKMEREQDGWFKYTVKAKTLRFGFLDSNGKEIDLGGTRGKYPSKKHQYFRTSSPNVWVKDELVYPYNPVTERGKSDYITMLTLNLHTYQEKHQQIKLEKIAEAINRLKPDLIAFSECAQSENAKVLFTRYGSEIKSDNMAFLITEILRKKYHKNYNFFWSWSHIGFDKYEEGCAILTNGEILKTDQKYITHSCSKDSWKSRNVIMAEIKLHKFGTINMFSGHLGWWNDTQEPFKFMYDNLLNWIKYKEDQNKPKAIFLAGDLNEAAGSVGYHYMMNLKYFIDTYAEVNPDGIMDPTIGGKIVGWGKGDPNGLRIDYILLAKGSKLRPVLAERTFTEFSYGRVSDHNGVYLFLRKIK